MKLEKSGCGCIGIRHGDVSKGERWIRLFDCTTQRACFDIVPAPGTSFSDVEEDDHTFTRMCTELNKVVPMGYRFLKIKELLDGC